MFSFPHQTEIYRQQNDDFLKNNPDFGKIKFWKHFTKPEKRQLVGLHLTAICVRKPKQGCVQEKW